ncbi:MAG: hypothetical protein E6K88_06385 [Thaumarchaeota archaeon]|nr:MAG: hypothetical protein E6K88_06385 [Nitrososphaerota archaeon]
MSEREYKEKVKVDENEAKIERESKDEFGNKVKEKHEIKKAKMRATLIRGFWIAATKSFLPAGSRSHIS